MTLKNFVLPRFHDFNATRRKRLVVRLSLSSFYSLLAIRYPGRPGAQPVGRQGSTGGVIYRTIISL